MEDTEVERTEAVPAKEGVNILNQLIEHGLIDKGQVDEGFSLLSGKEIHVPETMDWEFRANAPAV